MKEHTYNFHRSPLLIGTPKPHHYSSPLNTTKYFIHKTTLDGFKTITAEISFYPVTII
jgi:hypothetical protein